MSIFTIKGERIFRDIIHEIYKSGRYKPERLRIFFVDALLSFHKAGGEIDPKKPLFRGYMKEERIFMRILDELGIKVKKDILAEFPKLVVNNRRRESSIVTPEMRRGAREAQLRHSGVLKHDT